MFNTQLEKFINEQKESCPILTSKREFPSGHCITEIINELDPNSTLATEFTLRNTLVKKYEGRNYDLGIHASIIFVLGYTTTAICTTGTASTVGGISASISAGILSVLYPLIKAKYKTRKKMKQMKNQEITEGTRVHSPSYGTSIPYCPTQS